MENIKYGKRREGRWTPIRAKAQDTRANPKSWETHLVRKRWDIGLLWALTLWFMMLNTRGRIVLVLGVRGIAWGREISIPWLNHTFLMVVLWDKGENRLNLLFIRDLCLAPSCVSIHCRHPPLYTKYGATSHIHDDDAQAFCPWSTD